MLNNLDPNILKNDTEIAKKSGNYTKKDFEI